MSFDQIGVSVASCEYSLKSYVKVYEWETVSTLKQRLYEAKHGGRDLPNPSKWTLVYDGTILKADKTLRDYYIQPGTNVSMDIKVIQHIDMTLETRYNQTFTIDDLPHNATINDLKYEINKKYGIEIRHQIMCNGTHWDDSPNILDNHERLDKIDKTTLDLVIVDDAEAALKEIRKLFNPYKFKTIDKS